MKKVVVSLYDKYFRPVACSNDVYNTKVINFLFDSYDEDIINIMSELSRCSIINQISINYIFAVLDALEYTIEAGNVLKLNREFKSKMFKVDSIRHDAVKIASFNFSIYVDSFQTDIDDTMKRYLENDMNIMYDIYNYMSRGSGKSFLNDLILNKIDESGAYREFGRIHSKSKGGEINMAKLLPNPKRVICSGPVTTVIYGDGSKTHVRKTEDDENDYEKAFLLSWLYKTYGKSVVEKKLKEFASEFVEPEEPAYMGAVAEALNHVLKMSIGKKK